MLKSGAEQSAGSACVDACKPQAAAGGAYCSCLKGWMYGGCSKGPCKEGTIGNTLPLKES